jgi:hypothetical protein
LYVKFGSQPTEFSYDAIGVGAFGTYVIGPLSASTWDCTLYVMVSAMSALRNVQLWCDLTPPTPQFPTQLTTGKKVTLSITTAKQNRHFKIAVSALNHITCYTAGSSSSKGDPDLYVKFSTQPTLKLFNVYSHGGSTDEKVGPLSASTSVRMLYVMVHAFEEFSKVQLWCDLIPPTPQLTAGKNDCSA